MDDLIWGCVVLAIVVGLPWLIMHYVTKWKQAPKITVEDEKMLDEMFILARRLEERVTTVERIAAADHPDWKPGLGAPGPDWKPGLGAPGPDWKPGLNAPQPSTTYRLDRSN